MNNGPHWARLLRNTEDLSLQASSQHYLDKVRKQLERTWNITRQPLTPGTSVKHLGMKITRDTNGDITISNPALHTNLLAANGLNDCNSSPTPHIDGRDASKTTDADILTGKTAYQSTIGSSRFLADTTHPQLAFIIGSLGHHAHNPSTRHDAALKRVLRYLKGVQDGGMRFPQANGQMALEAYSDSDWALCIDTRCSTTGVIFLVSGSPVHYISSKQPTIAHSSTEAELVAANVAARDLTWFQNSAAHGRSRSAPQPSVSTISRSVRSLAENKLSASAIIALSIDNKGCLVLSAAEDETSFDIMGRMFCCNFLRKSRL
jgi:hypothetical protein